MHEDLTVRENLSYSAKLRCMAAAKQIPFSHCISSTLHACMHDFRSHRCSLAHW